MRNRIMTFEIIRKFSFTACLLALVSLLSVACDWNQFGNGPTNPHNSSFAGPSMGISFQRNLMHPMGSVNHRLEAGVTSDKHGSLYMTSYDRYISAYSPLGALAGSYDLGVSGPRAVPFIESKRSNAKHAMIFTGAEGGGFYAIDVNKTSLLSYALTLADVDMTFGASESSPKQAQDGTFYIADKMGEVRRYQFSGGMLTLLGTHALSEPVTGAIALYDLDPGSPGEEVLVATTSGNLYVLNSSLTGRLWMNADGAATVDQYYAGVTVAERGSVAPIAILPVANRAMSGSALNSGIVRAINLQTQNTEWIIHPSQSVIGSDFIEGSVALLYPQQVPTSNPNANPGGGGVVVDDPNGGISTGGGLTTVAGDISINLGGGGVVVNPNDDTITTGGDDPNVNNVNLITVYHATFASSDRFLYGIDLIAGNEVWHAQLADSVWDAPVVDRDNIIYVGDGQSNLYAFEGKAPMHGALFWFDNRIGGGLTDIVKLGIHGQNELLVGAGNRGYRFR